MQMRAFMGQHAAAFFLRKARRQVDRRAKQPQQKRRVDVVAEANAGFQADGCAHAQAELYKARQRQDQRDPHARSPDESRNKHSRLQGIDARLRRGRKRIAEGGIDRAVDGRDAGRDLRARGILRGLIIEHRLARHQTQNALDRDRQAEPHRRERPYEKPRPFRRLRENEPVTGSRQQQKRPCQRPVQKRGEHKVDAVDSLEQKRMYHISPPPRRSSSEFPRSPRASRPAAL